MEIYINIVVSKPSALAALANFPAGKHRNPFPTLSYFSDQKLLAKMGLRLGDIAPDFEAETTHGNIKFHEWAEGKWVILFSHPDDFTREFALLKLVLSRNLVRS